MRKQNAIDQNERMRNWFKTRTGLKSDLLWDHMQEIDRLLGERANVRVDEQVSQSGDDVEERGGSKNGRTVCVSTGLAKTLHAQLKGQIDKNGLHPNKLKYECQAWTTFKELSFYLNIEVG